MKELEKLQAALDYAGKVYTTSLASRNAAILASELAWDDWTTAVAAYKAYEAAKKDK